MLYSDYLQVDNIFLPEELRGTGVKEAHMYNKAIARLHKIMVTKE